MNIPAAKHGSHTQVISESITSAPLALKNRLRPKGETSMGRQGRK